MTAFTQVLRERSCANPKQVVLTYCSRSFSKYWKIIKSKLLTYLGLWNSNPCLVHPDPNFSMCMTVWGRKWRNPVLFTMSDTLSCLYVFMLQSHHLVFKITPWNSICSFFTCLTDWNQDQLPYFILKERVLSSNLMQYSETHWLFC